MGGVTVITPEQNDVMCEELRTHMEPLTLWEAGELASAWVYSLAIRNGIRALIVKGKTLTAHGLRQARTPADVDVLVEPTRFDDFINLVVTAGWALRPETFISSQTTLHSRTYLSPDWPCDIDVHRFFPGFLSTPDEVFEALWQRRETIRFGDVTCSVPDRVSSVLILALHSLRGSAKDPRHDEELEYLTSVRLTDADRDAVARLAECTGCAATLASVLPRLGVIAFATPEQLASSELREWNERVDSGSVGAFFWLLALRTSPWMSRPAILWRAIWPSQHDLALRSPDIPDTFQAHLRERVSRWGRGARSLPPAMRIRLRVILQNHAIRPGARTALARRGVGHD